MGYSTRAENAAQRVRGNDIGGRATRLLLACMLVVGLAPQVAWGDEAAISHETDGSPSLTSQQPAATAPFEGSGTQQDPYVLASAKDMLALSQSVNNGSSYANTYFVLSSDVDLSQAPGWQPIGTGASVTEAGTADHPFAGHFDGKGHTVTLAYSNSSRTGYVGLFGLVVGTSSDDPATVSHVVVAGEVNAPAAHYVAGVAGFAQNARFTQVGNEASVRALRLAAGIVGSNERMDGNSPAGDYAAVGLSETFNTGDIVADQSDEYTLSQAAGLVGRFAAAAGGSTIENSYNTGNVTGARQLGGLVGYWQVRSADAQAKSSITSSFNTGSVVSKLAGNRFAGSGALFGSSGYLSSDAAKQANVITGCFALDGCYTPAEGKSPLWDWYWNQNTDGANSNAMKPADEFASAAFARALGTAFVQGQSHPDLLWHAPLSPYIDGVQRTGIAENGEVESADASLRVQASLPQSGAGAQGTLSYQWYYVADGADVSDVGTPVGENNAELPLPALPAGAYDFYCVVTNSAGEASASLSSPRVKVVYTSSTQAAQPVISQQPQDIQTTQDKSDAVLSVGLEATSGTGFGAVTYQWYECADEAGASAAPVAGATAAQLTVSAEYARTAYYYCVVTNTYEGMKVATAQSRVATVHVQPTPIASADDLKVLSDTVRSGKTLAGKTYALQNDIDLTGVEWQPIGSYVESHVGSLSEKNPFSGVFDGQGHAIVGMSVAAQPDGYEGLFGYVRDATVKNVTVQGTVGGSNSTRSYEGGVVGYSEGVLTLSQVGFDGTVSGNSFVGGLVGYMAAPSTGASSISRSFAKGSVTGTTGVAGLAGKASQASFDACYSLATVRGSGDSSDFVAGLVGTSFDSAGVSIGGCYFAGAVDAEGPYAAAVASYGAQSFPRANYYLDTSALRGVGSGDASSVLARTQDQMANDSFVESLNDGASDAFAPNTLGGFPALSWERQIETHRATVVLSPQDAQRNVEVSLTADDGTAYAPVSHDAQANAYTFLVPDGTYDAQVRAFGYEDAAATIEVQGKDASWNITLTALPTHEVHFLLSAPDDASTEGALLWLRSSSHGAIAVGEQASQQLLSQQLPEGSYSYDWVLDGYTRVSGTFEVGAQDVSVDVAFARPTVWSGAVVQPVMDAQGTAVVTSAEELAWVSQSYRQGTPASSVVLAADVLLNSDDSYLRAWSPIGSEDAPFVGTFDGRGHEVRGVSIDSLDAGVGLFGAIGSADGLKSTVVRDLVVVGAVRTQGNDAALLAGLLSGSAVSIERVGTEGTVTGKRFVGGLVGRTASTVGAASSVHVANCYNKAAVEATHSESYDPDYVGGLVGSTGRAGSASFVVESSYNAGAVTGASHTVGGLIGTGTATLRNAYSVGHITAKSSNELYQNASGAVVGASSSSLEVEADNVLWLQGSAPRAFGFYQYDFNKQAQAFTGPEYFTASVLATLPGMQAPQGSSYNDGYPRLSWEDEQRGDVSVPGQQGSQDNPYRIESVADLQALGAAVDEGRSFVGQYVVLDADLDLTGVDFNPIGDYQQSKAFSGTFDGQGHAVRNLSMDIQAADRFDDKGSFVGLFAQTRGATIEHLEVQGNVVGSAWVGGIVGYAFNTHILNCISRVDVEAVESFENIVPYIECGVYAGGIAGQSYSSDAASGGIESCAYYGTARAAYADTACGIAYLRTSEAKITADYYLSAQNPLGTDTGASGAHGVDSLDSDRIAWMLNSADGTVPNAQIWGNKAGVCFADGTVVTAPLRVVLQDCGALLSVDKEFVYAGDDVTVTIEAAKKGYTLTSGLVVSKRDGNGQLTEVRRDALPASLPAAAHIAVGEGDVYVSVDSTFDDNQQFALSSRVVSKDDVQRTAKVTFKDSKGNIIDQARRGDEVTAVLSDYDVNSAFAAAAVHAVYADGAESALTLDQVTSEHEYRFTMPDADAQFLLTLQDANAPATERPASLAFDKSAFHADNSLYSGDGTYMGHDFVVDDDGTAGITTNGSALRGQRIDTVQGIETTLSGRVYYSQEYSLRDDAGTTTSATYTGIAADAYLRSLGLSSDLAIDVPVTFYGAGGAQVTLTYGQVMGYGYNSYHVSGDYAGSPSLRGVPVLLAAAKDGVPFSIEDGGPLKLVRGQSSYDDANGGDVLDDVTRVVVGNAAGSAALHNRSPYDALKDNSVEIEVRRGGTVVDTKRVSVADVESIADGTTEATAHGFITGARFGGGGQLQQTGESDYYQGANVWKLLEQTAGVTLADLSSGTATFYEEPFNGSDYSPVAKVRLQYLAGGAQGEGDYSGNVTSYGSYTMSGVQPVLATAKNGMPLVRLASDSGADDTERNYRGPFIAVLPYNMLESVQPGELNDAYLITFLGKIVLDLPEAPDKEGLSAAIQAANDAKQGVVVSADGSDVPPSEEWVTPEVDEALTQEIDAAQSIVEDPSASADDVSEAIQSLNDATQNYLQSKQAGTKPPASTVMRLAGTEAYDTAAAVSAQLFDHADNAVLARSDDFADAMSSTGFAGAIDAPVLLTERDHLSDAALSEINRLGVRKVYIAGGQDAILPAVSERLQQEGVAVERVAGTEAYDTSVEFAKRLVQAEPSSASKAIVATGSAFQDALSMSSFAYRYHVPIFLQTFGPSAADRGLPAAAQAMLTGSGRLAHATVFAPGGPDALSPASVEGTLGAERVERIAGRTAYDTSEAVAEYMTSHGDDPSTPYLDASTVVVATGADSMKGVDALAGSALAGRNGGVMLLANGNAALGDADYTTIDGFLTAHAGEVHTAYVLGGTTVAPDAVLARIRAVLP